MYHQQLLVAWAGAQAAGCIIGNGVPLKQQLFVLHLLVQTNQFKNYILRLGRSKLSVPHSNLRVQRTSFLTFQLCNFVRKLLLVKPSVGKFILLFDPVQHLRVKCLL